MYVYVCECVHIHIYTYIYKHRHAISFIVRSVSDKYVDADKFTHATHTATHTVTHTATYIDTDEYTDAHTDKQKIDAHRYNNICVCTHTYH